MLTIQNPASGSSQQNPGLVIISGYKDGGQDAITVTMDGVIVDTPVTFTSAGLWQTSTMVMQPGQHTVVASRGGERAESRFSIGAAGNSTAAVTASLAQSGGPGTGTLLAVAALLGLGLWWVTSRGASAKI